MFIRALAEERARPVTELLSETDAGVIVSDGTRFPVSVNALALDEPHLFAADDVIYLGRVDGAPVFAAYGVVAEEDGLDFRRAAMAVRDDWREVLFFAKAMLHWMERTKFCMRCGSRLVAASAGYVRRCGNAGCALDVFPRLDPAVIMLVTDGDRALLGRHHRYATAWTTFAGFVEAGESVEQAAVRELEEETGLRASSIRYTGSQPWPMPSSLMLGFRVEARGEVRVDPEELIEARWFTKSELRVGVASGETVVSTRISIAGSLIHGWLEEE